MGDTIQTALRSLYVSLGGDAAAVREENDINALLTAIAGLKLGEAIAAAAVKELPKVTATDNGKVLTVVSGEWKAADLPS